MHLLSVAFALLSLINPAVPDAPPALLSAIDSHLKSTIDDRPRFRHVLVDLSGDGRPEAIVLLQGTDWCGSGGCTMLVFRGTATGFGFVSRSTITYEPIRVLPENERLEHPQNGLVRRICLSNSNWR